MKNQLKKTGIAVLSILAAHAGFGQITYPATQPMAMKAPLPPPPHGAHDRLRPENTIVALSAVSGKVLAYTTNDHYEYDGFTLQTSEKTILVKFPAHLGEQVMKSATKGASVTINGTLESSSEGERFQMYSLKAGDKTIMDTAPTGTEALQADVQKDFSGKITELSHDARGMINGFIIDGKTLVELPPPAVEQLIGYLKTGMTLSGTVMQHGKRPGVITVQNMEVARARTLTIDGQTYLVR